MTSRRNLRGEFPRQAAEAATRTLCRLALVSGASARQPAAIVRPWLDPDHLVLAVLPGLGRRKEPLRGAGLQRQIASRIRATPRQNERPKLSVIAVSSATHSAAPDLQRKIRTMPFALCAARSQAMGFGALNIESGRTSDWLDRPQLQPPARETTTHRSTWQLLRRAARSKIPPWQISSHSAKIAECGTSRQVISLRCSANSWKRADGRAASPPRRCGTPASQKY